MDNKKDVSSVPPPPPTTTITATTSSTLNVNSSDDVGKAIK